MREDVPQARVAEQVQVVARVLDHHELASREPAQEVLRIGDGRAWVEIAADEEDRDLGTQGRTELVAQVGRAPRGTEPRVRKLRASPRRHRSSSWAICRSREGDAPELQSIMCFMADSTPHCDRLTATSWAMREKSPRDIAT
jgi:hypothetical protein